MDEQNPHKLSLQLTEHGEVIEIRAESLSGQARCETQFPSAVIVSQIGGKKPNKISSRDIEDVGEQLHKLLFVGDVGKLAFDIIETGRRFNQPVFIELRFDADQISLARFPWELIRNELGQYLVRDGIVDLTRSITYPQPMPSLRQSLKDINLLRVIARPPKLPPITTVDLITKDIETIDHATFPIVQRKLLVERTKSWGFQFDGHGALLLKCGECQCLNALLAKKCISCNNTLSDAKQVGVLAFEHNGDADFISTEEFGSILYNSGIQLALLLACETSRIGNELIFNGLAPNLILSGVPAVIGMQFPVLDSFANNFANSFYEVLFTTGDLFNAVRTARRMNIQGAWYSPAVYLRHKPIEEADKPVFKTRHIDTAVPEEVIVGNYFLVRLWIRRPTTPPKTNQELRKSLGISEHVEVVSDMFEADVKFEKVKGKEFRMGEVLVKLQSTECEIKTESIKLFVDENRDAPPAIFVVKANKLGKIPLVFSVWQEQNMIASIVHQIEIVEKYSKPELSIETNSGQVSVEKPSDASIGAMLSLEREARSEQREEERLKLRYLHREFRDRVEVTLSRNSELEQRLERLYAESRIIGYSHEILLELNKVKHELQRSQELRFMFDQLRREMALTEFPSDLYYEYRHLLERVEAQYEKLEFLVARLYQKIEGRQGANQPISNFERLLKDSLKAESQLPVLTILLKIFQVCPMMREPSVYEQMNHYSRCSRCFSYIRKEPEKEELHPLLKGFLGYCYRENLLRNLEQEIQLDSVQDNFPMIIHQWGVDLLKAFEKYTSEILPEVMERDYLEFKKSTFRK